MWFYLFYVTASCVTLLTEADTFPYRLNATDIRGQISKWVETSSLQQALSLRTSPSYLLSLGYKLAKATLKEYLFDIDGQTVAGNATHLSID